MQSTIGGVTTTFVGNYYEVTGSTVTKYYMAGTQRIAVRTGSTLNFLLSDQLGSTNITTDANGVKIAELRYKPWGETRANYGTTPTKYTYTGQYSNMSDFGLMFYNARWYDPALGRFAQADTVVPGGVQGYDRYAYPLNNPIRYTNPSGHDYCDKLNNNNKEDCTSGEQRIASKTRRNMPDWAKDFVNNPRNKLRDISAAEAAYRSFLNDPSRFAEYYVNPENAPPEYDALDIIAQYSELAADNGEQLIRNKVAAQYGMSAVEDLNNAKLHNFEAALAGYVDDILHVGGGASALWIITFGHGARHLAGLNVTPAEVESAISADINLNVSPGLTGSYKGTVTVNGIEIEYRAFPRGNDLINVGTYFPADKR